MAQWFYREDGKDVGPFSATDLLKLVREETINASTLVRKDESAWFPAAQVGGLFEAAVKPSVEYTCPTCGQDVPKPPTYCRKCRQALQYARPRITENTITGYEPPKKEQDSIADTWKQWVRRLKVQRDEKSQGGGMKSDNGSN